VRGFGSLSSAGNPLTPTLSPNGERERTEFAAPADDISLNRVLDYRLRGNERMKVRQR